MVEIFGYCQDPNCEDKYEKTTLQYHPLAGYWCCDGCWEEWEYEARWEDANPEAVASWYQREF